MGLVKVLANYIADVDYKRFPPEVVDQAKKCFLDWTGNVIGGRYTYKGEAIANYVSQRSAPTEATVIGFGKAPREVTAFANAAMSRVLDLDDGHRFAMGHPGCVVVPTVLALGEATGASGRDAIDALVAGYEVYVRLGTAINPSSYIGKGFDTTGVCGAVAAAAAASRLYKFNEEKTKDALGIAALHAGGFIEYLTDGSAGKVLCPGWAASTGIRAADLAGLGFTGPETVLEGSKGFFQAFSDSYDLSRLTEGLGEHYGILQNYFKIHACVRRLHPAIDALLALRSQYQIRPGNVAAITARAGTFVSQANKPHPRTQVAAQVSLPFVLAVALKHGYVNDESIAKSMDDKEIREIEEKVKVIEDSKIQEYAAANPSNWGAVNMEIMTADGKKVSQWTPLALGEPETPLSWEGLEEKFGRLIGPTTFAAFGSSIINSVKRFDDYKTVGEFFAALKFEAK